MSSRLALKDFLPSKLSVQKGASKTNPVVKITPVEEASADIGQRFVGDSVNRISISSLDSSAVQSNVTKIKNQSPITSLSTGMPIQLTASNFSPTPEPSPAQNVIINKFPQQLVPASYSLVIGKWSGYVENIEGDKFTAVLQNKLENKSDIRGTFSINDVPKEDRDLVCENALFDWVLTKETIVPDKYIGTAKINRGTIVHKKYLIFKRFPMWKRSDFHINPEKVAEFDAWLESFNDDAEASE